MRIGIYRIYRYIVYRGSQHAVPFHIHKLLHLIAIRVGNEQMFPLWSNAKRAASRQKQHADIVYIQMDINNYLHEERVNVNK